jgi:hypothetical protein
MQVYIKAVPTTHLLKVWLGGEPRDGLLGEASSDHYLGPAAQEA